MSGPATLRRPRRRAVPFVLSAARRHTLAAVCERLLPSDDGWGAREAGVAAYVERALAAPRLIWLQRIFVTGLDELEAQAEALRGQAFAACGADDQDAILKSVEARRRQPMHRLFFTWLFLLTIEGAFGDPRHGANAGESGWRYLGKAADGPRPGACRREEGP